MRVGIAAIVKSEAPYLLEWIAFHRAVGIDAFFIADNGGNDGTSELLKRLEKAGYITRFDFIGQPGAPQLYEELPGNIVTPGMPAFGPNSLKEVVMGDVEQGFREADVISEGTFGYENIPNPIPPEPPGAVAIWEEPNRVTLWVSNQASYLDTIILFHVFGRKVDVRTHGAACGGSFGTKLLSWQIQSHATLLSKATGRPVKLIFTKEEQIAAFVLRPGSRMQARVGMKKDGTVTAVSGRWLVDTGF